MGGHDLLEEFRIICKICLYFGNTKRLIVIEKQNKTE